MTKLDPAASVVRKFKGHRRSGEYVLASMIGMSRTAVIKWQWPRERGGCDGMIPVRHIPEIIAAGKKMRPPIVLSPAEFMPKRRRRPPRADVDRNTPKSRRRQPREKISFQSSGQGEGATSPDTGEARGS